MAERAVAYVLKGYPRRSELFIASEIWRLEQLGIRIHLIVLTPSDEVERHAVVDAIGAVPWHLPPMTSLSATTARAWLGANLRPYVPMLRRVAARHPLRLVAVAASAAAQSVRARDGWRPRKVYLKELLQAVAVADRVDTVADVAHLHAHFAHGSTTVTWWAARLTGRSFSFTGHAKDLYRPALNPAGLLARKLQAASFAITCTGANVDHLRSLGTSTPVHLVYHGLNPDFARLVAAERPVADRPRFRIVSVGRMVDKKGFDVLVEAVALFRDGGIDVELVLAGEDGPAAVEVDALIEARGLRSVARRLGPLDQAGLLELVGGSSVFALACRVAADGDRDGIPNVLVEAMAAGVAVVSTTVSGIPELVTDGADGVLVEPDDPGALAAALRRLAVDEDLRARLGAAGRRHRCRPLRRRRAGAATGPPAAGVGVSTVTERRARAVVCVIDGAGRDLAVADGAVAGRFTHLGVTLDLGIEPDWIAGGLAHDVEWRIEWVKATEGLDLAHAFAVTGDGTYLAAWERLVRSYATQVPVGFERSEVAARRMQHWLYAWQRFRDVGAPTSVDDVLTARLRADADHLGRHLTQERNHRTLELYALLLVGVAFDDGALARRALDDLAANARADLLPDGVQRERSSDYHLLVLRSLVGAVANARAGRLVVPPDLLAAVHRACDFALHLQRPDGMTPALSDGDVNDHRPVLTLAADVLDRPDLRWAATAGADGVPPARNGVFPVGGYCTLRSGWGDGARAYADERWGVFDCGPLGDGGHGHYDHLAVELWADGHALVLDAGRYTYADGDDGWRHWFKGTPAHNTVVVDGLDQTPYRPGKPKGPTSTARLVHQVADGGVDMVVGAATSPRYDAVHTRALALVGADHWVVHDRLRGDREHEYAVRWHLAPDADGTVEIDHHGDDHVVRAAGVRLTVPRRCGEVVLEQGWIAPTYGVKLPAPVVVVRVRGRDADVVTRIEAAP